MLLSTLVKLIEPTAILEIGTFRGRTTWHLFYNAPSEARIYTIDLPPEEIPDDITDRHLASIKERDYLPHSERIRQILVDTRRWDGRLPEKVQFAFIDGSHRYEDVKNDNDTEKVFGCLDEVACVVWHDSLWKYGSGVPRYLQELRAKGWNIFRVQEAREICSLAIWLTPSCVAKTGVNLPMFERTQHERLDL